MSGRTLVALGKGCALKPDEVQSILKALRTDHAPPNVVSLGRSIYDPIWREREHAGKHSELVHVLRGHGDLVMRDQVVHGQTGDTLYTPRGMPHRDDFSGDSPYEVYLVHFEWDGETRLLEHCSPSQLANVTPAVKAKVRDDFTQLHRDFQRHGPMSRELTSLRLLQIILTLAAAAWGGGESGEGGSNRRRWIMNEARAQIQRRYHEPLSLEMLAEALNVSAYHLSHVFSAESGFTLSSHLTNVRMERAAELLREGRLGVAEVSHAVGYRDPLYFSRVFKAHYGQTPSTFRSGGEQAG